MAEKNPKNVYFVGIEDPSDFRKEVLTMARSAIVSMKNYEKVRQIRKEKIELYANLKGYVREINTLVNKLVGYMPETKLRQIPVPKKAEPKPEPKKEPKKAEPKPEPKKVPERNLSELDKLDRELSLIESKLQKIK